MGGQDHEDAFRGDGNEPGRRVENDVRWGAGQALLQGARAGQDRAGQGRIGQGRVETGRERSVGKGRVRYGKVGWVCMPFDST